MSDILLRLHGIALAIGVPAAIYFFYSLRYRSGLPWAIRQRLALGVERAAQAFRNTWVSPPTAPTVDVSIDPLGRCDVGDVVDYADGVHWRFDYQDLLGKRLTVRGHRVIGVADVSLVRRMAYGGRKGRRAEKRLQTLAMGAHWTVGIGAMYALVFNEGAKVLGLAGSGS